MNIAGIIHESLVDGIGVRTVIFISGCEHNCQGCHNVKISDFHYGKQFDRSTEDYILNYIKHDPLIEGITLSGGDPIYCAKELIKFLRRIRKETPSKTVWLYTGFVFEEIQNEEILKYVDVLVDGKFDLAKADQSLRFKGSSNQRIIDVPKTLLNNKIEVWEK